MLQDLVIIIICVIAIIQVIYAVFLGGHDKSMVLKLLMMTAIIFS